MVTEDSAACPDKSPREAPREVDVNDTRSVALNVLDAGATAVAGISEISEISEIDESHESVEDAVSVDVADATDVDVAGVADALPDDNPSA